MTKNLHMSRAVQTLSAIALMGLAGLPLTASPAGAGGIAKISTVSPDINHNGLLRIGFNEKLPATRQIVIGLDKSMVIELPRDLKDVVVSNPVNLDAVVQTSNRVFLIAKKTGDANVFFFDENGEQVLTLEVRIERDMQVFDRMMERLIPGAHINSEILNDSIVLAGSVPNPADSARASEIAARFMQRPAESNSTAIIKVINLLRVEAKEQVMLKVTVAEVSRELIKRLGVNWNGKNVGDSGLNFSTNNGLPVTNDTGTNSAITGVVGPASDLANCASFLVKPKTAQSTLNCLGLNLEAFERAGLVKTLAEPTLTAISGETASFQAGGEFPVPVGQSTTNGVSGITISFKPFGVSLAFTPLVLSEGRISLKLQTEVSELSNNGAVTLNGISIPALKLRRANTTIELPSGGSLVIGGLISDDTRQNIDGLPGLKTLPILGTLFRSRDFKNQETELLVIATPYMVNAVARDKLALPTDNLDTPSDTQATLIGQLNRVYGHGTKAPEGKYHGNYGFIVE